MPITVFIFVLVQLIYVSYIDLHSRKISNYWSLSNIFLYLVLLFFFDTTYALNIETFLWPLGIFFAGFILFLLKVMGGGDSKYLSSLFLLVPFTHQEEAFISLTAITLIVGMSVFITNLLKNVEHIIKSFQEVDIVSFKKIFGKKFAFAPVILLSWMFLGWKIRNQIFF